MTWLSTTQRSPRFGRSAGGHVVDLLPSSRPDLVHPLLCALEMVRPRVTASKHLPKLGIPMNLVYLLVPLIFRKGCVFWSSGQAVMGAFMLLLRICSDFDSFSCDSFRASVKGLCLLLFWQPTDCCSCFFSTRY